MKEKTFFAARIIGAISAVLSIGWAVFVLFVPTSTVFYTVIDPSMTDGALQYVRHSMSATGLSLLLSDSWHWGYYTFFYFLTAAILFLSSDKQFSVNTASVWTRFGLQIAHTVLMLLFLFTIGKNWLYDISPYASEINRVVLEPGGIFMVVLSCVPLILNVANITLVMKERPLIREAAFRRADSVKWRADEIALAICAAVFGGFVMTVPYLLIKFYWKTQTAELAEGKSAKLRAAAIRQEQSVAEILLSYKTLLDEGLVTRAEFDRVKHQLFASEAAARTDTVDSEPKEISE